MSDKSIKAMIAFAIRNKNEILDFLDNFKPEDVESGILNIPEDMVNIKYRTLIMDKAGDFLKDYYVQFKDGYIYLNLDLDLKQLGPIRAKYMFSVKDLQFDENGHKLYMTYKEDVKSMGNGIQASLLKMLLMKGPFLRTAVEYGKLDFVYVDGNNVMIDIDKIKGADKIPDSVRLRYLGSEDGVLKFAFEA